MSVFVIAEAGVNHNGDMSIAKSLVDAAKDSGADCVKFQFFTAEKLATLSAQKAPYQINGECPEQNQHEMLKELELDFESHIELKTYSEKIGIEFCSSAFDVLGLEQLATLEPSFFKIPSGEITNLPYLRKAASYRKKIILSTGMANLSEVKEGLSVLLDGGIHKSMITILHCNSEYPTPFHDVNLNAMSELGNVLGVNFGYSDHTIGIEVPIAAVALGARCIEKHLTLRRDMVGPDQSSSTEPREFRKMVECIRNVEVALGTSEKKATESEAKNICFVRKSIVAKTNIKAGEVFSEENLGTKRPGYGISPMEWDKVIGTVSSRSYLKDEMILR